MPVIQIRKRGGRLVFPNQLHQLKQHTHKQPETSGWRDGVVVKGFPRGGG